MDLKELKARFEPKQTKVIEAEPQVHSARFTPCGKYLLAGSFDGRVRRWNVAEEAAPELEAFGGHNGWVQATAASSQGSRLFSGDSWGAIRCWRYTDEKPEPQWSAAEAHDGWIRALAVSPGGETLASCGADCKLRLWSAAEGRPLRILAEQGADLYALAWHPDGNSIFCGDAKGIVRQFETESGKVLREFDAGVLFKLDRLQDVGGVRCLALDREVKRLAVGGTKVGNGGSVTGIPTLLVFDAASGELKETRELGTTNDVYVCDVAWHAEGFLMAVTSGQPGAGKLLFLAPEEKEPFVANTSLANCHTLSLHPDGSRLAVVSTNRGSNGNGRPPGEYKGNKSPIHLFAFPSPT